MADLKWSNECRTCGKRYPSALSTAKCIVCKDALERTQKAPTVTEEEWKDLCYVYGKTVPGSLSVEDQAKVDMEWAALEAEASKRGEKWSLADMIGEGFGGSVRP